jgi:hypothetical protein
MDIVTAASYCTPAIVLFILKDSRITEILAKQAILAAVSKNRTENAVAVLTVFPTAIGRGLPSYLQSGRVLDQKLSELESLFHSNDVRSNAVLRKKFAQILRDFPVGHLPLPSSGRPLIQTIIHQTAFWAFESFPPNFDFSVFVNVPVDVSILASHMGGMRALLASLTMFFERMHRSNNQSIARSLLDLLTPTFIAIVLKLYHQEDFFEIFTKILQRYCLTGLSSENDTFFHIVAGFTELSSRCSRTILDLLTDRQCNSLAFYNYRNNKNETMLMRFAMSKHYTIVQRLLSLGADSSLRDLKGRTILHYLYSGQEGGSSDPWEITALICKTNPGLIYCRDGKGVAP